jgi:hypothetical protein
MWIWYKPVNCFLKIHLKVLNLIYQSQVLNLGWEVKEMLEPQQIEVKFTIALAEIPQEHRLAAERKAHEAFVMELLRQGDISAGKTARLLASFDCCKRVTEWKILT